jgi:hypothetical protein
MKTVLAEHFRRTLCFEFVSKRMAAGFTPAKTALKDSNTAILTTNTMVLGKARNDINQ